MPLEIIDTWNKEKVILHISKSGTCFCPVCGNESNSKDWRPYNQKGVPSYDICFCGYQFGYDDDGEPPYEKSWEAFRTKWLKGEVEIEIKPSLSLNEKREQLKNIGIVITKGLSRGSIRKVKKKIS